MSKVLIFLCFILIICQSCTINGSLQGLYSYYNKTDKENENLFQKIDSHEVLCEIKNDQTPKILITNGDILKKCLQEKENSIIYIWSPKCKSGMCYPLDIIQRECNNNGIELFVIAEYYDSEFMNKSYDINCPIIGIDVKYYKSNITSKYLSLFIRDLTQQNDIHDQFIFFEEGIYIRSFNNIDTLSVLVPK
ncbi:MAG: hypothetical protein LBQ22_11460 [Bacteroidales bacterium]|jgi:hypothetical protein|nr:hypothetical protein [Bacteroidales bacterium]